MRGLLDKFIKEAGYNLSDDLIIKFEITVNELKKWNNKVNLTAIDNDREIIIKHIIDSLALTKILGSENELLDVGSGAGFPAIIVKLVVPHIKVSSVDAVQKKIMFQKHLGRMVGVSNFFPIHRRIESMYSEYGSCFDTIISRAFSSLEQFVKLVAPLLKKNGRLIAMKGPDGLREINESAEQIKLLGFEISHFIEYDLPEKSGKRVLIVLNPYK